MNTTKPFDAGKVAHELISFLSDAMGDLASDMLSPAGGLVDDKWTKKIKAARRAKVRDMVGWLADELAKGHTALKLACEELRRAV